MAKIHFLQGELHQLTLDLVGGGGLDSDSEWLDNPLSDLLFKMARFTEDTLGFANFEPPTKIFRIVRAGI